MTWHLNLSWEHRIKIDVPDHLIIFSNFAAKLSKFGKLYTEVCRGHFKDSLVAKFQGPFYMTVKQVLSNNRNSHI